MGDPVRVVDVEFRRRVGAGSDLAAGSRELARRHGEQDALPGWQRFWLLVGLTAASWAVVGLAVYGAYTLGQALL